ncbi:glycerate kinase type-2 family protein [Sinisalibacter lacisalsi]|uniref:Hydroxypyruvate reductase n=1 Tax=Sinisalibacter lacisalsi TaxID=1526570 RepID=A0ABQ1QTR3_9RHOB|nr:glycerate kinase [Sinisalibacter lacisalsi]GGD41813.1 hydroxypyruvate reductase [Sinisalibacter lacisalsi]
MSAPDALLRRMFEAAISSARPETCLPAFLPPLPDEGRLVVIGAGKASAAMARAAELHYRRPLEGLVVTRYGHAVPCEGVEIVEAAHPVPDAAGREAARRILDLARSLGPADTALCLISGGGSALLALPAEGVSFEEKTAINRALLASGATIGEINRVRRHLSAIKGGRLAAACHPARVVTLLISDVPGDDPTDIASGPTVADPTTCADARAVIDRHGIALSPALARALEAGETESVKPGDPRLARTETHLVATPQAALEAAAGVARAAGIAPHILGDALEGEARDMGLVMAGISRQVATRGQPFARPCVLLSGGETTVTLRGKGRGGRNVEFLLALALALDGQAGVHAIAGDTDGVDGAEEVAGAVIGPDTLARARARGLSPRASLDDNDGHGFFEALGDQVITGPTLTNVNDFRAILIE